jgi:hypothetical protein
MGNWYQYWTRCCTNIQIWFSNKSAMGTTIWASVIGGLIAGGLFSFLAKSFIPGACAALVVACAAGVTYCNWWLHIRLICLGGNRGVIGAIYKVDPQTPSWVPWNLGAYDTDYCFNLLLYGATPADLLPNSFVNQFPAAATPISWKTAPIAQLQNDWPAMFPTIKWDDANLILPQQIMGPLGLGYTGQHDGVSDIPAPALGPLQSITVNPSAVSVPVGSSIEFQAMGYDPTGQSQDLTNSVTWSSSNPCATITGGGSDGDPTNGVATAVTVGTTNIIAEDTGSQVTGVTTLTITAGGAPVIAGIGPIQQMLLHCEIEGSGMHDLRTLLYWLIGIFSAATVLSSIPVVGWIYAAFLMLLAFLLMLFGGPDIQDQLAGPPDPNPSGGDGWGGFPYLTAPSGDSMVDILFVYGRWVFDSLHQPSGSNEIHPVMFVNKVGSISKQDLSNGNWSLPLVGCRAWLDAAYDVILAPSTAGIQSLPEFQFTLHPLLDGCQGSTSYAPPTTPPAPK